MTSAAEEPKTSQGIPEAEFIEDVDAYMKKKSSETPEEVVNVRARKDRMQFTIRSKIIQASFFCPLEAKLSSKKTQIFTVTQPFFARTQRRISSKLRFSEIPCIEHELFAS